MSQNLKRIKFQKKRSPKPRFNRFIYHYDGAWPHAPAHTTRLSIIRVTSNEQPALQNEFGSSVPSSDIEKPLQFEATARSLKHHSSSATLWTHASSRYSIPQRFLTAPAPPGEQQHTALRPTLKKTTRRCVSELLSSRSIKTLHYQTFKVSKSPFLLTIPLETPDDHSFIQHAWSRLGILRHFPEQVCKDSVPLSA